RRPGCRSGRRRGSRRLAGRLRRHHRRLGHLPEPLRRLPYQWRRQRSDPDPRRLGRAHRPGQGHALQERRRGPRPQRRPDAPEGRQPGTDRGAGPRHRRLDAGQPQVSRTTRTTTDAAPGRRPRFRPPPGRGPAMPHRRSSTRPRVPLLLAALLFAPPLALADNAPVAIGSLGRGEAVPGQVVVEGVVTADFRPGLGGFYLQDDGDGDPATPDALLVQAGADMAVPPGFGPGMHCRISGGLVEVRAGADRLRALAPSRIGPCREGVPVEAVRLAALPERWEPLEGMRVRIDAPLTVTGTHALERYGELTVSFAGRQWQPSELALPGTPEHTRLAMANARQRLLLDDGSGQRDPQSIPYLGGATTPRVGSIVRGVEGILERRHGSWRIQVAQPLQLQPAPRPQP